ncbi:hypothetical protein LXL04_016975 [Taraxacum kok-saghyz]
MTEISRWIFLRFLLLFFSISLQFLPGFSDDSKSEKDTKVDDADADADASSRPKHGSTIFIICILLAAVVSLSFFLFKLWQKKKREEQYARLLRLFEEDDELELELGLRD